MYHMMNGSFFEVNTQSGKTRKTNTLHLLRATTDLIKPIIKPKILHINSKQGRYKLLSPQIIEELEWWYMFLKSIESLFYSSGFIAIIFVRKGQWFVLPYFK